MRFKSIAAVLMALLFAGAYTVCADTETVPVTFELYSPDLAADAPVHLTGSLEALGGWKPDGVAMAYKGHQTWEVRLDLPAPMPIEYKYTLGSWDHEGADRDGKALPNFRQRITGLAQIRNDVLNWTDGVQKPALNGQVTGTLEYHKGVTGFGVRTRDMVVWLPPDYGSAPDRRYGVLYMHDGQNLFDPATASFGTDWAVDESMDRMIRAGEIEPMIVVGIHNSPDRTPEYAPGTMGQAYMKLVVDMVKPFIDRTYRTLPDKAHTLTGGSSSGGLISCMLGWQYPDVFGGVMCFSPAFKAVPNWDQTAFFKDSHVPKRDVVFYLDNGGIGLEERLQPGLDEMTGLMAQWGYRNGTDFIFVQAPEADHNEAAWAKRFPDALKWTLGQMAKR